MNQVDQMKRYMAILQEDQQIQKKKTTDLLDDEFTYVFEKLPDDAVLMNLFKKYVKTKKELIVIVKRKKAKFGIEMGWDFDGKFYYVDEVELDEDGFVEESRFLYRANTLEGLIDNVKRAFSKLKIRSSQTSFL